MKTAETNNSPWGMTGRRCHCIQASRIECMRLWASDAALINRMRTWSEIAASAGDKRLSSRGGNSRVKDAMECSDN